MDRAGDIKGGGLVGVMLSGRCERGRVRTVIAPVVLSTWPVQYLQPSLHAPGGGLHDGSGLASQNCVSLAAPGSRTIITACPSERREGCAIVDATVGACCQHVITCRRCHEWC
jgi:hypothetical protein